ncbi:MAG TPA: hypothetical protein VFQ13_17485 [Anaerolineales bacterium]|nr:hypothetical protein [Anaerolineales bacterium]
MNVNILTAWAEVLSIAAAMIVSFVAVWHHQRDKLDPSVDPLRWRRNTGMLIYGLSLTLSAFYMINRDSPVYTLGDLVAWVFVFLALSFLIWLVSAPLVMRLLEKTS